MKAAILILLGSDSDFPETEKGTAKLQELGVPFQLRIASAHRSPDHVHALVAKFESDGGKAIICVAGKSAHLAGVVAAMTQIPVLAVPVFGKATAGFDALLSMVQMPQGVPVATFGFGTTGFTNACIFAGQFLAQSVPALAPKLRELRVKQTAAVIESDAKFRQDFAGTL